MALRVWLPLNGNLNNQGLSNIQINNTGAIINNAGKIGKAYEFGANHWLRLENYAAEFLTYKEFTLSVWFKCTAQNTSHGGSALISGGNWNQPANLLNLALSGWATDHYTRLIISGSGTWDAGYNYNFNLNTWYHVALTSGNGKMRAYVNGELIGDSYSAFTPTSLEQNWICIGNGTYYSGFIFNGLMNDVRIYDECLSQKQIKEISKGLVVHYKLTGVGANPNLLVDAGNRSKWVYESCTRVDDTDSKVIGFSVGSGNQRIYLGVTNVWNSEQKYTYSFDAKASSNNAQLDASRSIADFGPNHYLTTEWQHYSGEISSTATASAGTLSIRGKTANTTYYLKNIKLENGEEETDYIPNINDIEYTALGYENDICTDVSGHGYTATKSGTLIFNSDSSRYEGSTKFNTNTSYIKLPALATTGFADSFTISCWSKITDMNTKMRWGFSDGNRLNIYPTGSVICCNTGNSANNPYQNNGTSIGYSQWNGGWHQFVMVADGTTNKLYVDGVYQGTAKTYVGLTGTQIYISGWDAGTSYTWTEGSINDFRIYATALSADDIKELYQTSGIIDNKGNAYSYEFKEE